MAEPLRLHAFVRGRVQGVGYRWHATKEARRLALTGEVRNLSDGRVEILAEGRPADLEALLRWARQGSPSSHVESVEFVYEPATNEFADFASRR